MPSAHRPRTAPFSPASHARPQPPPQLGSPHKKHSRRQDRTLRDIHRALHGSPPAHDPRTHLHLAQQALINALAPPSPPTLALTPGSPSSARLQEPHLLHWAHTNHLHLSHEHLPAAFRPPSHLEDDFMEHHVWPHPDGRRILKLTRIGHFGMWPSSHGLRWHLHTRHATPLRYLSRLLSANTHLADDIVLHAIISDSHGRIQILTSQPHYPGLTPGDIIDAAPEHDQPRLRQQQLALIRHALTTHGFHPTAHSPSTFYRPTDNLALFDAHFHNLLWQQTSHGPRLIPFDVILMHPAPQLRQNLLRPPVPTPSLVIP
ncbi:hypothetical protein [Prosthecobacter sp.]|uniref:hypothetical protein n=1 Tax=Prosthecobacter sp. TaxID=1965333 RepID=UPI0037833A51